MPYQPPLDWDSLLEFLAHRAIAGVELIADGRYRRTVACDEAIGTIRVGPAAGNRLRLEADLPAARYLQLAAERTRRVFDLDAEPRAIGAALGADPLLERTVAAYPGLRVPGCWDGFELAVRAVLGQQVTVRGASTLAARMVRAYGRRLADAEAGLEYLFPTARALEEADLGDIGLPRARAATLGRLAKEVASGRLSFDSVTDPAALRSAMAAIPGIGDWTAQYVAMRALRDPDAFPASDLVLLRAAADGGRELTPRGLAERAEAWRPWRAYAAVHLWKQSSLGRSTPAPRPPAARQSRAGRRAQRRSPGRDGLPK